MSRTKPVLWLSGPKAGNYPAAISYLSLQFEVGEAEGLVDKLRHARVTQFAAKDIFRSSGLSLLGISNSNVAKNHRKIAKGEELSPILLVRDTEHRKVIVADGYHRLVAVYQHDEDAPIVCKIVSL